MIFLSLIEPIRAESRKYTSVNGFKRRKILSEHNYILNINRPAGRGRLSHLLDCTRTSNWRNQTTNERIPP